MDGAGLSKNRGEGETKWFTFWSSTKGKWFIGGHYEITKFLGRGFLWEWFTRQEMHFFSSRDRYGSAAKILPKELRQTPGRGRIL